MIFDSSVWIEFLNGKETPEADLLQTHIKDGLTVDLCPAVYQEVLQGIRDDRFHEEAKDLLISLNFLVLEPYFVAEGAAEIFRKLKKMGLTIRKPNDCIIAFYTIHFNLRLVHKDKDFTQIAKHTKLKIYST